MNPMESKFSHSDKCKWFNRVANKISDSILAQHSGVSPETRPAGKTAPEFVDHQRSDRLTKSCSVAAEIEVDSIG